MDNPVIAATGTVKRSVVMDMVRGAEAVILEAESVVPINVL
jgi:hypothetical protein